MIFRSGLKIMLNDFLPGDVVKLNDSRCLWKRPFGDADPTPDIMSISKGGTFIVIATHQTVAKRWLMIHDGQGFGWIAVNISMDLIYRHQC
jgi:hypothetical protein